MTVFVQFVSIHKTELLKLPLPDPKLILFTDRAYYINVEREMATHSSILAWEITWREEAGRLQSMGSQSVDSSHALISNTRKHQQPESSVRAI